MTTMTVIDIGKDQWGMNIAAVQCDAVVVAICDAFTNNPYADRQYQAARAAGRRLGIYQFYRNNPAEADYFVAQTTGYVGQAVFILDVETDGGLGMVASALEALNRILNGTGVRPMVYIPVWLLDKYDWSPLVKAGFALWLPAYVAGSSIINGFNPPAGLLPPKWWGTCAMWQFTSSGRLPGYAGDLDLSIFYGSGTQWDAFTLPAVTGQGGAVTQIEDFLMALTDAQQQDMYNRITRYLDMKTSDVAAHVWDTPVHRASGDVAALQELADAKTADLALEATEATEAANLAALSKAVDLIPTTPASLSAAQISDLAGKLAAALPAANIKALAAQLAK